MGEDRIAEALAAKFGIQHSASTIRRYMVSPQRPPRGDQTWRTFVRNHAKEMWTFDYLTQYTALFAVVYIFVIMESSYRCRLDRWLDEVMGIEGIPIPYGAPNASPHVGRFVRTPREGIRNSGSLRRKPGSYSRSPSSAESSMTTGLWPEATSTGKHEVLVCAATAATTAGSAHQMPASTPESDLGSASLAAAVTKHPTWNAWIAQENIPTHLSQTMHIVMVSEIMLRQAGNPAAFVGAGSFRAGASTETHFRGVLGPEAQILSWFECELAEAGRATPVRVIRAPIEPRTCSRV